MPRLSAILVRLRSGWTVVALICLAVLALWIPDLDLPLGNSDDGRILGRLGLHARNFWELGPAESRFGAVVEPFIRAEYNVAPGTEPPTAAVTYAHHPPLQIFISIASVGLFGDGLPALRIAAFAMGSATVAFMAQLLRVRGMAWGPTLLAVTAMACTGFFYVYARFGVGYSLLVASTAAVAWLCEAHHPPRWTLAGVGLLAALTAMQSWIALAALALLAPWLFFGAQRRNRAAAGAPATSPAAFPRLFGARQRSRATATAGRGGGGTQVDTSGHEAGSAVTAGTRRSVGAWLAAGWSPPLTAVLAGAAVGAAVTAAWFLNATDTAELIERVAFRTGNDVSTASQQASFSFGEFLARQWRFASHELMAPPWLRALLLPALLAGAIDRRTRAPMLITLALAATLTFGFQQGAWIHRLWNFPWLAPATIGLAALIDAARRLLTGRAARLRLPAGLAAAAVAAATLAAVVTGSTRDFYLTDPAHAGAALAEAGPRSGVEAVWVTPGIYTPRWVSYYLDAPVWTLDEYHPGDLATSDLVLVRAGREPDYFEEDAVADPISASGSYTLISADRVLP